MSSARRLITTASDGVSLAVRLTPKSRRQAIDGVVAGADGMPRVKVAVSAPPAEGRANAALVRLLARALHVPASSVTIAAGIAARDKRVHLAGDPAELTRRLAAWAEGLPGSAS